MNPACETDEYARIRFTFRWTSAAMLPHARDAHASPAIVHRHSSWSCGNVTERTRYATTSAAIFVADAMNDVTGVGAPWYASGLHMWNGAADDLNPRPAMIIASPTRNIGSCACPAAAMRSKLSCPVLPYTRAEPNSSVADPTAPTTRYLSPASSEPIRSMSIAVSTYSAIENHSSPRKSVISSPPARRTPSPLPRQ